MSNYLKKILFTLLILGIPCMNSASKAMNAEDYEGSSVRARKVSFVEEDRQDIQSFTKQSNFAQVESLEDSKNSWTSYLSSSVKSMIQRTYDILDYTTRNPQKSMIIGLYLASNFAVVAADCCVTKFGVYIGCFGDLQFSYDCPGESTACSLASKCYDKSTTGYWENRQGCGGIISHPYLSVLISPGACGAYNRT